MALILNDGPASEPVTLAEAKAHLRIDGEAEDVLINSLIMTSRLHIEAALGIALISQSWTFFLDAWPACETVSLPLRPLQEISEVLVRGGDDTPTVLEEDSYSVDVDPQVPRLIRNNAHWPIVGKKANGIEIAFTAGYGDDAVDVPAPIRHALLLLIAHWYEHRDPIEIGSPNTAIPAAVSALLKPYRVARL